MVQRPLIFNVDLNWDGYKLINSFNHGYNVRDGNKIKTVPNLDRICTGKSSDIKV